MPSSTRSPSRPQPPSPTTPGPTSAPPVDPAKLTIRAVRLEKLIAALRAQAGTYGPRAGSVPAALRDVIAEYEAQLDATCERRPSRREPRADAGAP